jgi:hypothetical protein
VNSLEIIFEYAHDDYPKGGVDEPQEFDGDVVQAFYI